MNLKAKLAVFFCSVFLAEPTIAGDHTRADREALFQDIVAKTMAREAFSEVKNETYGVSYPEAFAPFRQVFIDADTDDALFYAIVKLSNVRNDRHLSVAAVEGGLELPERARLAAPVTFLFDFGTKTPSFFVAGIGDDVSAIENGDRLKIGDQLESINGIPISDYIERIRPFHRGSTEANFMMRLALRLHEKNDFLPSSYYGDKFVAELKSRTGSRYTISAPYLPEDEIEINSAWTQTYPGFEKVLSFTSFDFYRRTDDKKIVLFDWYGFRDDLVESMDAVMAYADAEDLLDHDVIWDGTQSRGGGRGAYAIQRLQSRPFKTTFGNVRISDVIPTFIQSRVTDYEANKAQNDGVAETVDDGSWLIDWLTGDVTAAVNAGQRYSNNVPFKSAHLPEYSDGILDPAPVHFNGRMVCWFGPRGGSHLDQFAAMVADNTLCTRLGMPTGGYSNTWEWEEVLKWPNSDEPVATFMWSIGHTIRPNGEVLEGNPADVDEYIPLTADNVNDYYSILLQSSYDILVK
ncbi:MAG: hypothetical protein AAGC77_06775 [Pseudomonadota bacterium]